MINILCLYYATCECLNTKLQGKGNLIHSSVSLVREFEKKLSVWNIQIQKGDSTTLPSLIQSNLNDYTLEL